MTDLHLCGFLDVQDFRTEFIGMMTENGVYLPHTLAGQSIHKEVHHA